MHLLLLLLLVFFSFYLVSDQKEKECLFVGPFFRSFKAFVLPNFIVRHDVQNVETCKGNRCIIAGSVFSQQIVAMEKR